MADTQLAGTGRGGQFWLATDDTVGTLVKMGQVVEFGLPKTLRDFIETTHLESTAKEYAPGLPDSDEIEITLNFRPGSDTDLALSSAAVDSNPRKIRLIVPIRTTLVRSYTFSGYITYSPSDSVTVGDKMESTVTVRVTGAITIAVVP